MIEKFKDVELPCRALETPDNPTGLQKFQIGLINAEIGCWMCRASLGGRAGKTRWYIRNQSMKSSA